MRAMMSLPVPLSPSNQDGNVGAGHLVQAGAQRLHGFGLSKDHGLGWELAQGLDQRTERICRLKSHFAVRLPRASFTLHPENQSPRAPASHAFLEIKYLDSVTYGIMTDPGNGRPRQGRTTPSQLFQWVKLFTGKKQLSFAETRRWTWEPAKHEKT